MIRIGMVGMSPGNGHPLSFSAILNGFDAELMARSQYPSIAEYLRREPPGNFFIDGAKVSHIWAEPRSEAEYVARTCNIAHVVRDYREMLTEVDAVILPNDDGASHLEMARPFLEARLPVFIDKPLADTMDDARELIRLAGPDGLLMSCSALRFSPEVERMRDIASEIGPVRGVHGVSWRSWVKYGIHLVEAVQCVFGLGAPQVRSLGDADDAIVHFQAADGPQVVLHVGARLAPTIRLSLHGERGHWDVSMEEWFAMFRNTLGAFIRMISTGRRPIPLEDTLEIVRLVLAAERSGREGGAPIAPADV